MGLGQLVDRDKMALYKFKCEKCNKIVRLLNKNIDLCYCGGKMVRMVGIPKMIQKEIIDNGIMIRSIEREVDIREKLEERLQKPEEWVIRKVK
jgi:hypothetical protein